MGANFEAKAKIWPFFSHNLENLRLWVNLSDIFTSDPCLKSKIYPITRAWLTSIRWYIKYLTSKFANFEVKQKIWPVYSQNLENLRPWANFWDIFTSDPGLESKIYQVTRPWLAAIKCHIKFSYHKKGAKSRGNIKFNAIMWQ